MNAPRFLLDSGPLIAALNRRDRHHSWAADILGSLKEPPLTVESVLTEVCWHLRNSTDAVARVLEMPSRGDLLVHPMLGSEGVLIASKIRKFGADMDLADACLVRLSEIYPLAKVVTIDRERFGLYRRNGREAIALVAP